MPYTPPAPDAIDFELTAHTPPAADAVDFELGDGGGGGGGTTFTQLIRGARTARNAYTATQRGRRTAYNSYDQTARGATRFVYAPFVQTVRGALSIYNSFTAQSAGRRRFAETFTQTIRGARRAILNPFTQTVRGRRKLSATFVTTLIRGQRRIANDAAERYELYIGVGEAPDVTADPDATSATLPIASGALDPGATYHLLTLRRNKWGLRHAVGPVQIITIDAEGDQVIAAPTSPTSITATALPNGRIRVAALYAWEAEALDVVADQWLVWAKVGSDPDPETDAVTATLDHTKTLDLETLSYDTTAFADAADVRVLVRVQRSGDSAQSVNTTASQVTATVEAMAPRRPGAFLGNRAKQQQ